jgi:hypothetical protein
VFREGERLDAAYTQYGEVAVPNQSGHIYLVTNRHGQHRLITVSRPTILGEMYGIITTLLAGRGSLLTPIAAPIAFLPIKMIAKPTLGRVTEGRSPTTRPIASICARRSKSRSRCSCEWSALAPLIAEHGSRKRDPIHSATSPHRAGLLRRFAPAMTGVRTSRRALASVGFDA